MNKDKHKKVIDEAERLKQQREDNKKFTNSFFGIISLLIGFYTAYDLFPPNDLISFIGFMFMGLVTSLSMLMLFSFIFQF